MADTVLLDLATTAAGDLILGANGDLALVRDSDCVAQEIAFRLKTVRGDWVLEPECGADLELLIGQPNSPETGAQMETLITNALTHDGYLLGELSSVRAVPLNRTTLAGIVTVDYGDLAISETITLDLAEGRLL